MHCTLYVQYTIKVRSGAATEQYTLHVHRALQCIRAVVYKKDEVVHLVHSIHCTRTADCNVYVQWTLSALNGACGAQYSVHVHCALHSACGLYTVRALRGVW